MENQKPGNKSTEFWLSVGIILAVMIVSTVLLLYKIITADHWTKIQIYVCGIVGPVYAGGRALAKTFGANSVTNLFGKPKQGEP